MRIAIGVEYDGSGYAGWQSQAHAKTVQDTLETALKAIAGCDVRTHAAGRTDAGVHALEQVVHFDTAAQRPLQAWIRGVNAFLPDDVAVRWAVPVADDFHARFCALSRSYRYLLLNTPVRPALYHDTLGWHHRLLDVERMNRGASCLIGEHDFSSFRSSECQASSPVKTLRRAYVKRRGNLLVFEFVASGFLHHMVRNIVGALIWVGCGRREPEWMTELLGARDRTTAPPTFQAAGLYFTGAVYAAHWKLPTEGRIMLPFDAGDVAWPGHESSSAG